MDVIKGIKYYINQMISRTGGGMKALLMDKETISIISMAFAQSEMLQKEVFLFERLDAINRSASSPERLEDEQMRFMKCIAFLRPTEENIEQLRAELKFPRYGQYYIYFSNVISKTDIKLLAECDDKELVRDVEEFYCDYMCVSPHLFTSNIQDGSYGGMVDRWNDESLKRVTQAIIGVLLSICKCPTIRYAGNSGMARKLAESVRHVMNKDGTLFEFSRSGASAGDFHQSSSSSHQPPVLLILDRRMDAVTPLLNQWTYQAMLHELLTINNNRVNLQDVPGVTADLRDVVLSADHDEFFERNMYLNYGEIGANIKELMDEFQRRTKSQSKVETIQDMKQFIETYPQFKKMSGTVSKHVTLVGHLSRLVSQHDLLEVSECEQEMAAHHIDHSEALRKVKRLLANDKVRDIDALRLVLLFVLRFEKTSETRQLIEGLQRRGLSERQLKLVHQILEFGGSKSLNQPGSGFGQGADLLNPDHMKVFTKKMIKGLRGVENIYTQHTPLLGEIVEELLRGKLREQSYPYLGGIQLRDKPQEVIVYMVGGLTYEESAVVYQLNSKYNACGQRVIVGGCTVHNFRTFTDEIRWATSAKSKHVRFS